MSITQQLISELQSVADMQNKIKQLEDENSELIDEKKPLVAERDNYKQKYETATAECNELQKQLDDVDEGYMDELITPLGKFHYIMPNNLKMQDVVGQCIDRLKAL